MGIPLWKQSAVDTILAERDIGTFVGWGTTAELPAMGSVGYSPGCLWGAKDTGIWYINEGTFASANFAPLFGGGTVTLSTINIAANTGPNDLVITDGTTNLLDFDSRNTVTGVTAVTVKASPPTIASATGDTFHQFGVAANTVTLTGTTTVTALDGIGAYLGVPTVTDASAGTVTTVSNLYVAAPAAAGGSLTITNSYAVHSAGAVLVDGNLTVGGGTVSVSAAATTVSVKAATAASLVVSDGVVSMLSLDTRTTTSGGGGVTVTGEAVTLASAGSAFKSASVELAAKTSTLTGTTTTTSWLGTALYVDAQTWTDSSSCTLTTASAVHIVANAAAGGSLTITNSYMISTSVSGCYLTNAGAWTSVSSAAHKEEVVDAEAQDVFGILDQCKARSYKWKDSHVNDFGRKRHGLIAEELPEALRVPGGDDMAGLPDGVVAAFAVAACKMLRNQNLDLLLRIEKLEAAIMKK